jgi:glycosyltransferase involved in cell wall biosynthesis
MARLDGAKGTAGGTMPTITMVADSLGIGGAERHVVTLCRELAARGHRIRLLCSAPGRLLDGLEATGIVVRVLGEDVVKRRFCPRFAHFIADDLSRAPADIVHAHMFASAAAAAAAIDGGRTPLVVTEHSEAVWRTPADCLVGCSVYLESAAVIAVSAEIGERLTASDGVPPGRVFVIPNGINLAIRAPSRTTTTTPVVGFVGRLRPEKGVRHLIEAAASVVEAVPTVRFVLIGDGPERARLHEQAASLGLGPPRLRFLGARPDGSEFLRRWDVLAVPSLHNEGTPLVVLEAMAARVPIVASRTGGIPTQVRDRQDALLVEPGNSAALARALIDALSDRAGAMARAASARRRLVESFQLSDMVDAVEAVYRSVADRSTATSDGGTSDDARVGAISSSALPVSSGGTRSDHLQQRLRRVGDTSRVRAARAGQRGRGG